MTVKEAISVRHRYQIIMELIAPRPVIGSYKDEAGASHKNQQHTGISDVLDA